MNEIGETKKFKYSANGKCRSRKEMIKFFRIFARCSRNGNGKILEILEIEYACIAMYRRPGQTHAFVQGMRADVAYLSRLHRRFARVRVKSATLPASLCSYHPIYLVHMRYAFEHA